MKLSRIFILFYMAVCIPLMATNPNSAPDQQPSFKDRVKDTLSQGAAYVSSVITGNTNTSAVNVSGMIQEDKIIHLIFMGKTGAGKSTFINTFYNFASGTKWDDFPKKFPIKSTRSTPAIASISLAGGVARVKQSFNQHLLAVQYIV